MDERKMMPTAKMRWLRLRAGEIVQNHPSAMPWGDTGLYLVLQQFWIPETDEPDDYKAHDAGEWRDLRIEDE
jgi:hypothetical protein